MTTQRTTRTGCRTTGFALRMIGIMTVGLGMFAQASRAQLSDPCGFWAFGANYAVAQDASRQLFFSSAGGAVLVWDVADPFEPILRSDTIQTQGLVLDMFYTESNQRLYIAADEGGLEVWDVQDPDAPAFLGSHDLTYYDVPVPAVAVHVQGDFAYIAADFGLVQWVDITDPANMFTAGFNGAFGVSPARDVFIADGHLYAAGDAMVKFAIEPDGSLFAEKVSLNYGTRIFVQGNYGYLADTSVVDFVVIDIVGVPESLFLPVVDSFDLTGNVREVVLEGDRAYAVDPFAGITIFDATDPESLTQTGSFSGGAGRLIFNGDYGFTASGSFSRILDFTDPDNPVEITQVGVTAGSVYDVEVNGKYAYLASSSGGFQVLDTEDAAQPYRIAQLELPGSPLDVQVADGFAYVAAQSGGLRLVDVSDPANPIETGAEDGFTYARRVFVQGDYAYATELQAGVRIMDVSDHSNPHEVAFIPLITGATEFVEDVFAVGSYLYVTTDDYVAGDGALYIFDISDPSSPSPVSQTSGLGEPYGLFVEGDLAYVTSADSFADQLRIVDVSNPAAPVEIGSYFEAGLLAFRVVVRNDKAYVTDAGEGVRVLDVSNPTNPTSEDFINTPGDAFTVSLNAGRIYISDGVAGLRMYGTCTHEGDHNGDGTVDLNDYAAWPGCLTGPDMGPYPEGCGTFDFDLDDDLDAADFSNLQRVFSSE